MHQNYVPNTACLRLDLGKCGSAVSFLRVPYTLCGGGSGSQEPGDFLKDAWRGSDVSVKQLLDHLLSV